MSSVSTSRPETQSNEESPIRVRVQPGEFLYGEPVAAPLYSICIPTYARPEMLKQAVASALNQRFDGEWEVIVCENSKDPETLRVISAANSKRVRLWRNTENVGMVGNWNQCIALAAGAWVTILHDDDLLSPWFLHDCHQAIISTHTPPAALFGRSTAGGLPPEKWDRSVPNVFERVPHAEFLLNNPISFPGVCFQRSVAIALDGFDVALVLSADYNFWSRLSDAGKLWRSVQPLSFYRISNQQCSVDAISRVVSDFRRAQDLELKRAGCNPLTAYILKNISGVSIEGYYRKTYGGPLSFVYRAKLRLCSLARDYFWRRLSREVA